MSRQPNNPRSSSVLSYSTSTHPPTLAPTPASNYPSLVSGPFAIGTNTALTQLESANATMQCLPRRFVPLTTADPLPNSFRARDTRHDRQVIIHRFDLDPRDSLADAPSDSIDVRQFDVAVHRTHSRQLSLPIFVADSPPPTRNPFVQSDESSATPAGQSRLTALLRDVAALRALDHENVVTRYEVVMTPRQALLVHASLSTDLGAVMREGRLGVEHARLFAYQLLRALKYMHSARICHSSLSPAQLMIDNADLMLKVTGFVKVGCEIKIRFA
jgi:serine/threonine protein kinase